MLKKIEEKILKKLEFNARMPFSKIGKSLNTSEQRVSYIVKSLKKRKKIHNFYTIIDYSRFNLLSFKVYFRINYLNEKKQDELIKFLVNHQNSYEILSCGGRYDLICNFVAHNPSQFNKILKNIIEQFPEQLQNYEVLTTTVIRYFGKKFFFESKEKLPKQMIIGGDRIPLDVSPIDKKILAEVATDARKSSVLIAEKLNITPKTVISRINNLKKNKIILGYKPLSDIGNLSYFLLISYHNISTELEKKFIEYLKFHPRINSLTKTLGSWDLEIEIEVPNLNEFRKIERQIRKRFAVLIQQIESIPIYSLHKRTFFPRILSFPNQNSA